MRKLSHAIVVSLLLGLLSCQTLEPPPAEIRENLQPQYLINHLINRQSGVHTVKSFLKASIKRVGENKTLKQALIVDEKKSVRLNVLGLFGSVLGVLIHTKDETSIFDLKNGRTFLGAEAKDVMEDVIGSSFDMQELILVLLGRAPGLEQLDARKAYLNQDKTHYFLSGIDKANGEIVEIEIESSTLLPSRLSRRKRKDVYFNLEWKEYIKIKDQYFPLNITLSRPRRGEVISLQYDEPSLNEKIEPGIFDASGLMAEGSASNS